MLVVLLCIIYFTRSFSSAAAVNSTSAAAASSTAVASAFSSLASALADVNGTTINGLDSASGVCVKREQKRNVLKILWSCLTTISACTWIAVHPNIPHPKATGLDIMKKRVVLFIWGIITPELIVLWALRQWAGMRYLRQLSEKCGHKISKKQAHLVQMGGFMLFKNETRLGLLSITDIHRLMGGGGLVYRNIHYIPRSEVKFELPSDELLFDRSKADSLSKGLVLVQTSWFTAQCLSRWAQHLVVTQLELVTLAFAVVNACVYYLWWHKPLGVRFAERVVWKTYAPDPHPEKKQLWEEAENGQIQRVLEVLPKYSPWRIVLNIIYKFRIRLVNIRSQFHWTPQAGSMCASPFTAETPTYMRFPIIALSSALATGVGALHCIGWSSNFTFPTHTEKVVWRVCSLFIAVAPLTVLIWALAIHMDPEARDASAYYTRRKGKIVRVLTGVVFALAPFYILARVALLVESLLSLRALQPGALVIVKWTSFLPHL